MSADPHVLEIKSTNVFTLRLVLKNTDFSGIVQTLHKTMERSGEQFKGESIVIDAYMLVQPLPWRKLVNVLEQYELKVLGIYTNERLLPTVIDEGFVPIELSNNVRNDQETSSTKVPEPTSKKAPEPLPVNTSGNATIIIDRQLRSGERVYATGGDLIVIGNVGHGAEVIADGNIHVYGHLRGRAIAGAKGDSEARIFTTYLDPQLVAIAGIYRLFDADITNDNLKKTVMISLQNETLAFETIKS